MNILGMGPMEIVLIVVLALIVFGPAKLPEIMGQVGKAIADFLQIFVRDFRLLCVDERFN